MSYDTDAYRSGRSVGLQGAKGFHGHGTGGSIAERQQWIAGYQDGVAERAQHGHSGVCAAR